MEENGKVDWVFYLEVDLDLNGLDPISPGVVDGLRLFVLEFSRVWLPTPGEDMSGLYRGSLG